MTGYALHPEAYTDIQEIADYIAEDSPAAARRVVNKIFDAIGALIPFPHQGHRRPDLTSPPLRFLRVYEYLIAYAPDEKPFKGNCCPARAPQSPDHGRDSEKPRIGCAASLSLNRGEMENQEFRLR